MSYDRQLDQICQHTIINEAIFIDDDRQTIRPQRAIAAGNQVKVYLNGTLDIPSSGLRKAPSGLGSTVGPFTIVAGVSDFFRVRLNDEEFYREAVLTPAVNLSAEQLALRLNQTGLGLQFFADANRIGFQGLLEGNAASVLVTGESTLAVMLGLQVNQEYRGSNIYPGWYLVVAPRTIHNIPYRHIVFDEPLWCSREFVQITYTTIQQECSRCGGTGVENDWRYNKVGGVVEVRDEALLIQECLKLFYTQEGSNPFHPWYGTRLVEQIGRKIVNGGLIQSFISQDIYRAFNRWVSIKRQQEAVIGQEVTNEEYPIRLLSVDVQQSQQDPTVFFVQVVVQNRSGKTVEIERGVRVPEPQDLLGSTAQQGVMRQSLQGYVLSG